MKAGTVRGAGLFRISDAVIDAEILTNRRDPSHSILRLSPSTPNSYPIWQRPQWMEGGHAGCPMTGDFQSRQ